MRLTIKDFSVLKNVDINLDDVTVIIGEQASGKSLTARVLFFFADYFFPALNPVSIFRNAPSEIKITLAKEFYQIFPKVLCGEKNFNLGFSSLISSNSPLTIEKMTGLNEINFSIPKELIESNNKLKNRFELATELMKKNPSIKLGHLIEIVNNKLIEDVEKTSPCSLKVTYIPSGRSFFSNIQKNIFFLTDNNNFVLDPTIRKFGQDYQVAKERLKNLVSFYNDFDRMAEKIIKGGWVIDDQDKEFIINNGNQIPLAHASSGQQEALPLVLMLENELLAANDEKKANKIIVIEEPEAHLFPASQRAIVDLIFQVKKQCPHVKFLITTHSPYILTCINNEIMKAKRDKVTVGVDSYFMADGVSTRIFDDETGLINGEKLDEISGEIADEFYALLENEA